MIPKNFQKKLLRKLLDKYYCSNNFKSASGRNVTIGEKEINDILGVKIPQDNFEQEKLRILYGGPVPRFNDMSIRREVNKELETLKSKGYILLEEKETYSIELYSKIILNIDKIDEIITKYNIFDKKQHEQETEVLLKKYKVNSMLKRYIEIQLTNLSEHKKVEYSYFK